MPWEAIGIPLLYRKRRLLAVSHFPGMSISQPSREEEMSWKTQKTGRKKAKEGHISSSRALYCPIIHLHFPPLFRSWPVVTFCVLV